MSCMNILMGHNFECEYWNDGTIDLYNKLELLQYLIIKIIHLI